MSTAIYHHLVDERVVNIKVGRPRSGGDGFVIELDAATGGAQLTVFVSREQLAALHAATTVALAPARVLEFDPLNGRQA